jgi:hypothetical protein
MILMLALSLPVWAATIAHWDMNDAGAADAAFMPGNSSREADITSPAGIGPEDFLTSSFDLSGNGNHLSAWTSAWMKWTNDSFRGDFGMIASNGSPDSRTDSEWSSPVGVDLQTLSPTQWTVECVFKATAGTNRAMVGRKGYGVRTGDTTTAPFYLAERSDQRINCEYVDATGAYYNAVSANGTLVAGTWYHVAAVSNGTTLNLYLKDLTAGTDYTVVATAPLTSANTAIAVGDGVWTVACGTWNNGTTDRFVSPGIIDEVAISDTALEPGKFVCMLNRAYQPNPQPVNTDGTVGTLNGSNQAELTLNFNAGKDPNTVTNYPVNPAIVGHYVYLSNGVDSNLALLDYVEQVHNPDPNLTDPANFYGPIALNNNAVYYWQIEEALDDGTGIPNDAGDPNNIPGSVWSFTTIAAIPTLTNPKHTVADANGNASFSVTGSATATSYQWFKVGTPDVTLSDTGIYSGTTTATLTITGAAIGDEGQYYCIAYNDATPSIPSNSVWLLTQRLVGYWKLDGNMDDSVGDEVIGALTHDGSMNTGDPNYLDEPNSLDGTAMQFFNDSQFMTVPDSDFFNFYRNGFTFSCWYKDAGTDGWRVFFSKLDVGAAGWLFGKNDTSANANFIIESPNTNVSTGTAVNVSDGSWHMLTATYDAATDSMKVFVDGDQRASATIDLSNVALPATLVSIGGLGTDAINGAIDEVRMYSYPRTPTQIAETYLGFKPGGFICADLDNGIGVYDLNDDCRVNMADFALVATQWLECNRIPEDSCSW